MRVGKVVLVPALLFALAMTGGSWLLQSDRELGSNLYFQTRLLDEVLTRIDAHFVDEVDVNGLYRAAIEGVVEQLGDRNSTFLEAAVWEDVRIRAEGEYGGIGMEVVNRDDYVTVVAPIPGTPGARAGLRSGDRIIRVDGESVVGQPTDQVVGRLRGKPGTPVRIGIQRPGLDQPLVFEVSRALIQLPSVPFAAMLDGGVGYVPLNVFNGTTTAEVRGAIDSLASIGMTSLVLDLRNNRGGLLTQGVALTDLFLDRNDDIVEIRGRSSSPEMHVARAEQSHPELPLAVLIGHGSASAAEIVAGALQDHDRALLVGSTTFGKGSVQSLFPLPGGNVLKLTTARWYTPSGRSIQRDAPGHQARLAASTLSLNGDLVQRPDLQGKPEFESRGGRRVLGGGGIVPDVWVMPDTLTSAERGAVQEIFNAGGGFFASLQSWVVGYLGEHPKLHADFVITDADLESFYQVWLERARASLGGGAEAGGEDTPGEPVILSLTLSDVLRARRYVVHHMEAEISSQLWGDLGRFERMQAADIQLQRAAQLLRAAQDQEVLFRLAGAPLPAEAAASGSDVSVGGAAR